MTEHDLEKSFMYWAGLASHLFSVSFNNELSGTGLTYRQAQILICLNAQGELAQNELAAHMQIEPPTLVGILDRMERDGLIKRLPSPGDRRKKIVSSTEKSDSRLKLFTDIGIGIEKQAAENLSKSQVDTVKEILKVICKNLGSKKGS